MEGKEKGEESDADERKVRCMREGGRQKQRVNKKINI